jgi:hypothetical protein
MSSPRKDTAQPPIPSQTRRDAQTGPDLIVFTGRDFSRVPSQGTLSINFSAVWGELLFTTLIRAS